MCSLFWQTSKNLISNPPKKVADWMPELEISNIHKCILFMCRNSYSVSLAWSLLYIIKDNYELYNNCLIELSCNTGSSNILKEIFSYIFKTDSSYLFTKCIINLCKNPSAIDLIKQEKYILNDINLLSKICSNPNVHLIFDIIVDKLNDKCWYVLCHNENAFSCILRYYHLLNKKCWIALCYSKYIEVKDIIMKRDTITKDMLSILCLNTVLYEIALYYINEFDENCWISICENPLAIDTIQNNLYRIPKVAIYSLCTNYNAIDLIIEKDLIKPDTLLQLCLNKNAMRIVSTILETNKNNSMFVYMNLSQHSEGLYVIDRFADQDVLSDINLWYNIIDNEHCEWIVSKYFNFIKDTLCINNNFWTVLLESAYISSEFKVKILLEIDVPYDIRIDWQSFCHDPKNITWISNNSQWLIDNNLIQYVYANEAIYYDDFKSVINNNQPLFDEIISIIMET